MACRFSKRMFYLLTSICMVTWVIISYLAIQSGNSEPDRNSLRRYHDDVGQGHGVTLEDFYDPRVVEMEQHHEDLDVRRNEDDYDDEESDDAVRIIQEPIKKKRLTTEADDGNDGDHNGDDNDQNNKGKHGDKHVDLNDKYSHKGKMDKWINHRGHMEENNEHMANEENITDTDGDDDEAEDENKKEEEEEDDDDEENGDEEDDDYADEDKAAKYIPEDLRVKQQMAPVEDDGEEEEHDEEDLDENEAHDDHENAHEGNKHNPAHNDMKDVFGANGKANIMFNVKADKSENGETQKDGKEGHETETELDRGDNHDDTNDREHDETDLGLRGAPNKNDTEEDYIHTRYKIILPLEDNEKKNETN